MLMKRMLLVVMALLTCGAAFAAGEADLKIRVARPGATVEVDRIIKDGRALVSVVDAAKEPLIGLKAADFSLSQAGKAGVITSVQPMAESMDVPRHIVMVLDNSYSMYERQAIKALLAGVNEVLKTVRPIDDVLMIAFDNNKTVKLGGRDLHVQSLRSSQQDELRAFANKAYQTSGLTAGTVLYEAILAGLDAIGSMPATEPRFMVVFSDGEDLNSVYKSDTVYRVAKEIKRFNAYTIDYQEAQTTSKFLSKFARDNGGKVFKAKSEANLVPIFQSVASKMLYYYVVSYQFPPTGKLAVSPAELTVDELKAGPAAPLARISAPSLTLRPSIDSAYGIARWKAVVSNAAGVVGELSGEGNPAGELYIPLPTTALQTLAVNGDLNVKVDLEDRNGQSLTLTAPPVKLKLVQTRAGLAVAPAGVTVEEINTIDVSPMLGHIFFDKAAGEIPARYVRFASASETAGFDEQKFSGTLEKYYQDLNIIGKRLAGKPEATITLVGCNDNTGKERGNKRLSTQRAEAVRNYLQTIWNIAPERMTVQARNLPAKPSSVGMKEGQAENRRVEILSSDMSILAPIRSTYVSTRADSTTLTIKPDITAPYGITTWKVSISNASGLLGSQDGRGTPAREFKFPLPAKDLKALASGGDITVRMELQDSKGQNMILTPDPVKMTFIQTSKRLAEKQGLVVQEKYALILFDFDKDTIGPENQEIVNRIVGRIKTLPQAKVEIVGHTDNIGKDAYNQKLSERRALAVYKQLTAAYGEAPGDRIRYSGVGSRDPLFDNLSPEARSFNRTVTITLEYLSAE